MEEETRDKEEKGGRRGKRKEGEDKVTSITEKSNINVRIRDGDQLVKSS